MTHKIRVLLFAGLAQRAGSRQIEHSFEGDSIPVQSVVDSLESQFPFLVSYPYSLAVNGGYVDDAMSLKDGDELALIPPVSGG